MVVNDLLSDLPPDPFSDITVAVKDVQVRYRVPSSEKLAQDVPRRRRPLRQRFARQPLVSVRALSQVTFAARSGEQIGIVGQNGSGKSTLLRIIAGLERPTRGCVHAQSIPVLIGVNAALIGELSGIQNARLGCLAMGMTPSEADAAVPEIVGMANLGQSIHLPMKTYSSGMSSRLRFAIATAMNPKILLIDEALATGDAASGDRYANRMKQLREHAGTVFLVSHAAQTIEETCTRAIWLHHGHLVLDGAAEDVALRYRKWAWAIAKDKPEQAQRILQEALADRVPTLVSLASDATGGLAPRHASPRTHTRTPITNG